MGKYISFGEYNHLYKYIWFFVIIKLVNEYIFGYAFPEQIRPDIFNSINYPSNKIVQRFFNYLSSFILSAFIILYEKSQTKKQGVETIKFSNSLLKYKFEFFNHESLKHKIKSIVFFSVICIISNDTIETIMSAGFNPLIYWEFDLFIIAYINLILYEYPLFTHKKLAIIIVSVFSSLFQIISTFEYLFDDKYNLFYKNHIIIIPIITITYPLLSIIRFYAICKIKWLLDYKFVPLGVFYSIFSFSGMIIFLIASFISTYIKCPDMTTIYDIDLICTIKIEIGNTIEYYFDNYFYFIEKLWDKDSLGMNILYIFLFIIRLILESFGILLSFINTKNLNPEYYQCSYQLLFFIIFLIELIKAIINDDSIGISVLNLLTETISLISIMIYLEIIELKFCGLNNNLKKYIEKRGNIEYEMTNLMTDNDS